MAKIPKNLFKGLKDLAESDKKDDSKHERTLGAVAKIPIATTFDGLAELDFVDY